MRDPGELSPGESGCTLEDRDLARIGPRRREASLESDSGRSSAYQMPTIGSGRLTAMQAPKPIACVGKFMRPIARPREPRTRPRLTAAQKAVRAYWKAMRNIKRKREG